MKKNFILLSTLCLAISSQAVGMNKMSKMKEVLLTQLRNKNTNKEEFEKTAYYLGYLLAAEVAELLPTKETVIETPCGTTGGIEIKDDQIVLIPILRSGLGLLGPFKDFFPNAKVGEIGLRRNEKNPQLSKCYRVELPTINSNDKVIILEPMLATTGSIRHAAKIIKRATSIQNKNIIVVCVVAAEVDSDKEGLKRLRKEYPGINIICGAKDKKLNENKYIVPGLGDFGDRLRGKTPEEEIKSKDVEGVYLGSTTLGELRNLL